MDQFREQLEFLMSHDSDGIIIDTINYEHVRIKYWITYLQADDFLISSISEGYTAQTDFESLLEDFEHDTILQTRIVNEMVEVDYTRKIPKIIEECPICLESLIIDICANRSCRHLYHCRCITQWDQGTCPVCRKDLDLYKLQDIDDYRKTAGFLSFGSINSDIKYLTKLKY